MTPSWRKPVGMLGILAYVILWMIVVASFSHQIGSLHVLLQLIVYLVAGIIWIFPLKPVLRWMETGRFSLPPTR